MAIHNNVVLSAVMRQVRANRPPLPTSQPYFTRVERVPAGNYVEIWFLTTGCTWDNSGGCTMCNYGAGPPVSPTAMVDAVRDALDELAVEPHELMVSPSGGMWDRHEVTEAAVTEMYALARAAGPGKFFVETRAETVSEGRVAEMREALPGVRLAVEVGLESSSEAVLRYCVNKGSGLDTFLAASGILRPAGVELYANVSLGTAFLTHREAVRDAVWTARWALGNGADRVVVFPLHIKPYTLLDLLAGRGLYQPVSLWDLVDVLASLGPELSDRVEIAWYKSYYDTAAKISRSPVGCASCTGWLVEGLDRYRGAQDYAVVEELLGRRCPCANARPPAPTLDGDLPERVWRFHALLMEAYELGPLWSRYAERYREDIHRVFEDYSEPVLPA
jgi:radical SAM enzyme (TIGR01210 family)